MVKPRILRKRAKNGLRRNKGIDSYAPYMLKYVKWDSLSLVSQNDKAVVRGPNLSEEGV